MSGKYTWKMVLIASCLGWAIYNLIPFKDTPFEQYLRQEAADSPEFQAVMAKAAAAKKTPDESIFVALKRVASEGEGTDLSRFFPQVNLEKSLVNVRKRNAILLDELLRRSKSRLTFGLDLRGGVSFILEIDPDTVAAKSRAEIEEDLTKAIDIITRRIDSFGVAEPIVRPVGDNRIEVQIAGLSTRDNPEILDALKKPAKLEFRLVDMFNRPDPSQPDEVPTGYVKMTLEREHKGQVSYEDLFVKRVPEMTGESVKRAGVVPDDFGNPEISLTFTSDGADRFADVTRAIEQENQQYGRGRGNFGRLAIVLDGKLYSAPEVERAIPGGSARIFGSFTAREAFDLANVLNNPLDVPLRIVSMSEVGSSMAEDAVSSGWKAFVLGTAITVAFIAVYYTSAGLMAVLAMAVNVLLILGVMAGEPINATLSMPGIAGIVLTIAMSVDANILIFERMREELASGKNLRASLVAGFEKAFSAIFDANITTLITGAVMIWLGTGPVKGFGITLTIGIFTTMFAALVVTRLLLELAVNTGWVTRIKMFSMVPPTSFDYLKYAKPAFIGSWMIVAAGIAVVAVKGGSIYGIDFAGGDELTLGFQQRASLAQVRTVAESVEGVREATPVYQTLLGKGQDVLKIQVPFERSDAVATALQSRMPEAGFTVIGETRIGPAISSQIQWNALLAIALSIVGILIYVAFRFEIGYGIGAVVSTVHDVIMTVGIFVIFDRQFSAPMVGAILLIVGYSINDTIVIFDRIREELTLNPNMRLREVINLALNRTLARTVITGGTTFCTAITLCIVAGGAVNDIAFTLLIGLITGTFSSVYIASPVFYWWHKGDRKHVEATHDLAPKYEWSAGGRATE